MKRSIEEWRAEMQAARDRLYELVKEQGGCLLLVATAPIDGIVRGVASIQGPDDQLTDSLMMCARQNRRLKDIMTVLGGSALLLQQTRQTNKLTN